MLLVRCPKCGNQQKTNPLGRVNKSVKRCVYCGKSFKIHTHQENTRIVLNAKPDPQPVFITYKK